jgi:hypothetical protein
MEPENDEAAPDAAGLALKESLLRYLFLSPDRRRRKTLAETGASKQDQNTEKEHRVNGKFLARKDAGAAMMGAQFALQKYSRYLDKSKTRRRRRGGAQIRRGGGGERRLITNNFAHSKYAVRTAPYAELLLASDPNHII